MAAGFPGRKKWGTEMEKTIRNAAVDYEWAVLIAEAKIIGMTTEEVRQFLQMEAEPEKGE